MAADDVAVELRSCGPRSKADDQGFVGQLQRLRSTADSVRINYGLHYAERGGTQVIGDKARVDHSVPNWAFWLAET